MKPTKHYINQINNPADSYTYKFENFHLPKNHDIFTECVGGSLEKVEFKYVNDILEIITPIWTTNPEYIKIGYSIIN